MRIAKHVIFFSAMCILFCLTFSATTAQAEAGTLDAIIIYKGDTAGTGTGIGVLKLKVGEEVTVTAKGVDSEGKEVPIWPTWKCDRELSIRVVEGRSKTAVVKALKESTTAAFFEAVYITDEGKKVTGTVAVEIKPEK